MTVGELKSALAMLPSDMEVLIAGPLDGYVPARRLHRVEVKRSHLQADKRQGDFRSTALTPKTRAQRIDGVAIL